MAFTDQEQSRIRYFLGYLNTEPATGLQFGLPKPVQALFLVDLAMQRVLPGTEPMVRNMLNILEGIEEKLVCAQDYLVADKLEQLTIRRDHTDALEKENLRWASRLADILGVPLNPFALRFQAMTQTVAGSIPVRG